MSKTRLLILDDDPMTGQTLAHIAEFAGAEVRFTTSPDEFFRLLEEWQPDTIALDLVMPQMDGVQVMSVLADRGCTARLIISSGVGSRVLDAAGRSAAGHGLNIAGVLPKPFTPAEFRALLADEPPAGKAAADTKAAALRPPSLEDIRQALQRGDIHVVYQPKVACRSSELTGFEVLARWQHPELGAIAPETFIALAESGGLIDTLTEQVLALTLDWFARLHRVDGPLAAVLTPVSPLKQLTLSINVSARSLGNLALFERLERRCEALGLAPERLIFELTETSAMEDPVASLDILTRLRMKGFQLSLDDFGTGFSSMLQLVRLPFSELKVDKSFVMTAGQSQESRAVIKSVIDLGHSLGLQVTAEGIEDQDTLGYLREQGCDLAQGYLIARPMAEAELLAWIRDYQTRREAGRLQSLHDIQLLDTPPEERFDRLTRLARRLFDMPVVLVSLVDEKRQWFKSRQGLEVEQTPREISFCTHAIEQNGVYVVGDTLADPAYSGNPLVTGEPGIRFYAGCPLRAPDGNKLGTLCLIDKVPRLFGEKDVALLADLAYLVERELVADRAAGIDHLTGLLNRQGFEQAAEEILGFCARRVLPAALLWLDLNEFKRFSEQGGQAAGEQALVAFADVLQEAFRESDLKARLRGNEFVVLLIDTGRQQTEHALERLEQMLAAVNAGGPLSFPLSYALELEVIRPDRQEALSTLLHRVGSRERGHGTADKG
ncbi:EAL domain-containing protein [Zobellella iuensis]|uniref:EAL domain-containing protein n=1 Tax=Zobellella iuensis TaxID=2803811 RepID=A0ABS1QRA0_9GAMM|nr:EAL domain-containing protein [Zobellella iuensis]MBL1377370.1 EAL domain-containing protein [Zobellella iuensis]